MQRGKLEREDLWDLQEMKMQGVGCGGWGRLPGVCSCGVKDETGIVSGETEPQYGWSLNHRLEGVLLCFL